MKALIFSLLISGMAFSCAHHKGHKGHHKKGKMEHKCECGDKKEKMKDKMSGEEATAKDSEEGKAE